MNFSDIYGQILDRYEQFWTDIDKFWTIWKEMDKFLAKMANLTERIGG